MVELGCLDYMTDEREGMLIAELIGYSFEIIF